MNVSILQLERIACTGRQMLAFEGQKKIFLLDIFLFKLFVYNCKLTLQFE